MRQVTGPERDLRGNHEAPLAVGDGPGATAWDIPLDLPSVITIAINTLLPLLLENSDALRRVFDEADNAAAIACYPDRERELEEVVRAALKQMGLSIDADALDYAVSRLGSDRGVTRSELEKLALYAMGENTVTIAHVGAVMGDESELRMDETFDAAGEGEYARLDVSLSRLWAAGT